VQTLWERKLLIPVEDIADPSAAALAAMKKFTGGQDKPVQQQGGNMQSGVSSLSLVQDTADV